MPRASPSGPAPGETMRDPLTPPSGYLDHAAARRIVVGVLLTMLLAALDQVMVATALPTIAASLGDVENMSWVVTANLLSATAAALRQALRRLWPARHAADRHRRLCAWIARLRAGAIHAGADLRPRRAGTGWRRPDAAGSNHHRRCCLAARPPALPGLHLLDLHRLDRGRPDPRRFHCRAFPLVLDFLVQPAALRARLSVHPQCAAAVTAPRPSARARCAGRRADGGGRDPAAACAHLGWAALWLGLAADSCALRRLRNAMELVRVAHADCERALHSGVGAARRRHARRHRSRLLRRRRGHCADHRAAPLCPACAL